MPSTPALDIEGLTVRYGQTLAVDGLDLRIEPGETVALLGPNGAGKSSTVNAALGLFAPSAGRVSLLGRTPREAVQAGCVGAMLQHGGLPAEARVGEVVHLVRRAFPQPWPESDLLTTTGIGDLLGRKVSALSGGQRQRVLLALALAGAPLLLVLDEPTAAMDVESRRAFWTTMRELAGRGHTIVFATHYLEEADAVADRVIVIAGGRVVADGSAAQIKASASGRTVRFTADPRGPAGLADVAGVEDVQWHGGTVHLRTRDPEATLRSLLRDRDRLPDLEVRGASLEDAFVSLLDSRATTTRAKETAR